MFYAQKQFSLSKMIIKVILLSLDCVFILIYALTFQELLVIVKASNLIFNRQILIFHILFI